MSLCESHMVHIQRGLTSIFPRSRDKKEDQSCTIGPFELRVHTVSQSLLVRDCQGVHISPALSRPRVEGKEFWVFRSDAA